MGRNNAGICVPVRYAQKRALVHKHECARVCSGDRLRACLVMFIRTYFPEGRLASSPRLTGLIDRAFSTRELWLLLMFVSFNHSSSLHYPMNPGICITALYPVGAWHPDSVMCS